MVAGLLLAAGFGFVSVTNHAGAVMSGELVSVTNGTFTLGARTLPLAVLPADERRRLEVLAGRDVRTAKERQAAKRLDYELRRIDARRAAGEISEGQADELRRQAQAASEFRLHGRPNASRPGK